ncbi:unannotated protein [freshwater metagenome]|uniref:Unannotated protein n=1 Tax=freshwater metagenome TaxID=449393 RepID=A0A6J6IQF4_9ZZZZ
MRIDETLWASAGIGTTTVQHHSVEPTILNRLHGPLHWRCLKAITSKYRGRVFVWPIIHHQRNVVIATGLDSRFDTTGPKALRCSHTHGATPIPVSPDVSAKPAMRLAF